MVIPEIGLDELPMMPTMRLATVTKKKPNTTTSNPSMSEPGNVPGKFGKNPMTRTRTSAPMTTNEIGRSRSVRRVPALPAPFRSSRTESRKLDTMVGRVRRSVMTPAHATAPAPMYFT